MNVAYKHLDSKLRIAELSLGQWIWVAAGVGLGVAWGAYLSPLGSSLTLVTAVYLGALPVAGAVSASLTEFDPWLMARSGLAWRRRRGRFVAGAGHSAHGYTVTRDEHGHDGNGTPERTPELDLAALWEQS